MPAGKERWFPIFFVRTLPNLVEMLDKLAVLADSES